LPVAASAAPRPGEAARGSHSGGGRLGDRDGVGADERSCDLGDGGENTFTGDGVAYEGHPPVRESGDAPASRSRFADDEVDEAVRVVIAGAGFRRAIRFEF